MTDVDDWEDDYEPYEPGEPDEPDWGADQPPPFGREHRRRCRYWRHQLRTWRKTQRHARDRFWQARNPTAFDTEAPF